MPPILNETLTSGSARWMNLDTWARLASSQTSEVLRAPFLLRRSAGSDVPSGATVATRRDGVVGVGVGSPLLEAQAGKGVTST